MKRTTYAQAQVRVIEDLRAGLVLWGPVFKVGDGEIRERNADYVRHVDRATLASMLDDGLIVEHPGGRRRYILTERGEKADVSPHADNSNTRIEARSSIRLHPRAVRRRAGWVGSTVVDNDVR